jgi:hypothetical protein
MGFSTIVRGGSGTSVVLGSHRGQVVALAPRVEILDQLPHLAAYAALVVRVDGETAGVVHLATDRLEAPMHPPPRHGLGTAQATRAERPHADGVHRILLLGDEGIGQGPRRSWQLAACVRTGPGERVTALWAGAGAGGTVGGVGDEHGGHTDVQSSSESSYSPRWPERYVRTSSLQWSKTLQVRSGDSHV